MDECGQEEKDLHNEFARLHPQLKIHVEYADEVRKNMILMDKYKCGKLPDIIQLGSSNIPYLTEVFFITKAGLTKLKYHTRTMIGLGKIFYSARFTSIIAM
jgi:hypothetical protein